MRPLKTITIADILPLLNRFLGVKITRATLYQWMEKRNFPRSTGLGRPRVWNEKLVRDWIAKELKKSR